MPLVADSSYRSPFLFKNRHIQTIYPALFRKILEVEYTRERITLSDGDFIDLDWSVIGGKRLVVLLHGLEGRASRHYMKGMAKAFNAKGWDAVAVNFRGCSGEPNHLPRSYHAGATEDLRAILEHVKDTYSYASIGLVGFSLGGNVLLKYLGEEGEQVSGTLCGAVAFSVPCDLASSSEMIALPQNRLYMQNFLKNLRVKIEAKAQQFPEIVSMEAYDSISDFRTFDDTYTAPLHGFTSAEAYWEACSCISFLPNLRIPTLLVNALDDPFLGRTCYPVDIASSHDYLLLEMPDDGGHVGFIQFDKAGLYWSEQRASTFLTAILEKTEVKHLEQSQK